MKRLSIIQCVLWAAVIIWIILTLFLTFQNGLSTAATSSRIATVVYRCLRKLGINISYTKLHQTLRVSAHFVVFFVFGLLFAAALLTGEKAAVMTHYLPWIVLVCTVVSLIPEVIKQWIPGRHLQWDEAFLNLLGALSGALGIWGLRHICLW